MADPAAAAPQQLLPGKVQLPLAAAAELTSDELINQELAARGKIRLGYGDLMTYLVFKCCVRSSAGVETERVRGGCRDLREETTVNNVGDGELSEQKLDSGDTKEEEDTKDDEDEEETDWREEYRTKGYVEVDKDYYVRRAERQAMLAEEWAKIDFSGLTFADSDDEMLKACTIPLGALHPRIRQPLIETEEEGRSSGSLGDQLKTQGLPIGDREKTEEEVDQEIIAFLRRCLAMDPKPKFLRELDRYQWPWPADQEYDDSEDELTGQEDNSDHPRDVVVDIEDFSADS